MCPHISVKIKRQNKLTLNAEVGFKPLQSDLYEHRGQQVFVSSIRYPFSCWYLTRNLPYKDACLTLGNRRRNGWPESLKGGDLCLTPRPRENMLFPNFTFTVARLWLLPNSERGFGKLLHFLSRKSRWFFTEGPTLRGLNLKTTSIRRDSHRRRDKEISMYWFRSTKAQSYG